MQSHDFSYTHNSAAALSITQEYTYVIISELKEELQKMHPFAKNY
ncbi:hypothetical protein [Thalassotalea eurytherma]|nr:hypothetical protein [Thalassotalea eurytherma]